MSTGVNTFEDREKARAAGRVKSKIVRCPKCGETFQNLPVHMRACEGERA